MSTRQSKLLPVMFAFFTMGFVDMVGYREDALALLAKKLGSEGVRAVKYEKQSGLLDELLGMKSPLAPVVSRLGGSTAKREYRWAP